MSEPQNVHVPPTLFICFGYKLERGVCHVVFHVDWAEVLDSQLVAVAELEVEDDRLYDDPALMTPLQLDAAVRDTFVSYDREAVQVWWSQHHSAAEHAAGRQCRWHGCQQCREHDASDENES
jgi:hypothetical protein